jgi:predicted aminopeptidase
MPTKLLRGLWQRRVVHIVLLLGLLYLLGACSSINWYGQAARGQWDILQRREDIGELLSNPATPEELAQQLRYLQAARQFASAQLHLPDNGSYRDYADLQRDAAVWTLVVTPELSLEPKQWCYPLVGCQSYRGYFKAHKAIQMAHRYDLQGYDALVLDTPAYSTLGWFDDPILNTMLGPYLEETAGTIFHELAHQVLYVAGDTGFNEAYATWVGRAGTRAWLENLEDDESLLAWEKRTEWRQNYYYMLQTARDELARAYNDNHDAAHKRQAKTQLFQQLRERLEAQQMPVPDPLNNAQLAIVATYEDGVKRFAKLFQCHNMDWKRFHAAAQVIAEWPAAQRQQWLQGTIDTPPEVCHLTRAQRTEKDKP